jgi:CO/xanthine dehydrogenase Mo-binding subunit
MTKYNVIGHSRRKLDGEEKVNGSAKYAADLKLENMAYIGVFRSSIPHGIIKKIDYSQAEQMDGVISILTEEDVPGQNGTGIIFKDEPVLTSAKVKQVGDPIVLVVAEEQKIVDKAVKSIEVEYEELPAIFSPEEASAQEAIQIHDEQPNIMERKIVKGDVKKGFADADIIVEKEYKTGRVEHSYIEPEAGVAKMEDGIVTIWVTSQNVHFDRGEVARTLNMSINKVRVINTVTGGGFGGKLDVSAQVYLGLAALKTGRPVKYVYSREESIQASGNRHPYTIKYKSGAKKDGTITAAQIDFIIDTGAYASYGPGVLTRGAVHATGPYEIPNVDINGKLAFTNNPFCGAMRGFGVPQMAFAHESQMDLLAEKLGLTPFEVRMKNAHDKGSVTATGQELKSSVGIKETISQATDLAKDLYE